MKFLFAATGLIVAFALPADAQQLNLQIGDGRVTLDAVNVPARQILAEWARVGGTKIVGGDKITGAPLTLKFVDMPERQALDIILRNVAGFMAAPRLTSATAGASTYDRILIMATSAGAAQASNANARTTSAGVAGGGAMNGTQRRLPPRPPNLPPAPGDDPADTDNEAPGDQAESGTAQPVFTFPAPGQMPPGNGAPVFVPMQNGAFGPPAGAAAPGLNQPGGFQPAGGYQPGGYQPSGVPPGTAPPVITLQPGPNGPTIYNFVPNGQPGAPAVAPPTTGFGVIGSPTPGMIQVPPAVPWQPTPPGQPTPTTRPPK